MATIRVSEGELPPNIFGFDDAKFGDWSYDYEDSQTLKITYRVKLGSDKPSNAVVTTVAELVPDEDEKPTPVNLYQLLEQAARDPADNGMSFYSAGNVQDVRKVLSYTDLLETAQANACLLPPMDTQSERVVLLHFDNHLDGIEWYWSVIAAGYTPAISTPFTNSLEQRKKHILHLKTLLKDPIILTTDNLVPEFLGLQGLHLETVEGIRARKSTSNGIVPQSSTFAGFSKTADATAVLMLTSGSTGNAKAVCLRHGQLLKSIKGKALHHGTNGSDSYLNWIGLDHVANLTETHLHAMFHGANQVHVQAADLLLDPKRLLSLISKHRITHTFAPNFFLASLQTALENLNAFESAEKPDLSHFRILISGGEANVVETSQALTSLLREYRLPADREVIRPGFGMTETCAGSIYSRECPSYDVKHKLEFNSLGSCIPGLKMRITNDSGDLVGPNETGSLELSGEILFHEYYNNPIATTEAFTSNGWFITGDRALIDSHGHLCLTGRAKESIIINGVKYFPHELESALDTAAIEGLTPSYTAVFAHRPKGSQTEVLCVVYLPSYESNDVQARVNATDAIARMSIMQCGVKPHQITPLEASLLPKSSLGKLSRAKIRTAFESGVYAKYQKENDKLLAQYRLVQRELPRDDTEARILKLFTKFFDLPEEELGINNSLFEMGVSSIEIIKLKTQIQMELNLKQEIPVITMMTNPTIRGLAAALKKLSEPKSYSPVVTLQAEGSKTPLWLVHPGVGEVLVFLNLAKYIIDRPVYALRARGFDEGETFFNDIPEVVKTYHAAIKEVQPEGPYAIAGYSYGSMLAFEVNKVLESKGDEVKFLGALNLPPHIKFRMRQLDWVEVVLNLSYFLDLITETYAHEISPDMHKLSNNTVLDFIISKAPPTRMSEMALDKQKLTTWADLAYRMQAIAQNYDPSGMVANLDVFYAIPLSAVAKSKQQWLEEHLSKWEDFVDKEVRFHEVEGAHYTMISPLHVFTFQKTLRAALQARGLHTVVVSETLAPTGSVPIPSKIVNGDHITNGTQTTTSTAILSLHYEYTNMTSLSKLAAQISEHAKVIEDTIALHNLPQPSFLADGPTGLPDGPEFKKLQKSRSALIDAARSIEHLATGPEQWIKTQTLTTMSDQLVLSTLAHFDFFSAVPLDGSISYADLASKVGLPEERVRRFVRQAMTNRVFRESKPGYVTHTAASAVPVRIPSLKSFIGHNTEDGGPASNKVIQALEKWGASEEPAESGFGLAWGLDVKDGKDCVFRFVAEDGEGDKKGFRMKRIGEAMESMKGDGTYNVAHAQQGFDWASLGKATVVDLGGSVGHLSIEIASKHPDISCVVQDFPELKPQFEASLPTSLTSRVSFQGHDIFTPQPVAGADIYAFRLVFHDWPDAYCIQMIQQVVPVMKKGSRILAIDCIIDRWDEVKNLALDRLRASMDLHMMAMMNAKERSEDDWKKLFSKASPELEIKAFVKVEGSALGFVEVVKIS